MSCSSCHSWLWLQHIKTLLYTERNKSHDIQLPIGRGPPGVGLGAEFGNLTLLPTHLRAVLRPKFVPATPTAPVWLSQNLGTWSIGKRPSQCLLTSIRNIFLIPIPRINNAFAYGWCSKEFYFCNYLYLWSRKFIVSGAIFFPTSLCPRRDKRELALNPSLLSS